MHNKFKSEQHFAVTKAKRAVVREAGAHSLTATTNAQGSKQL